MNPRSSWRTSKLTLIYVTGLGFHINSNIECPEHLYSKPTQLSVFHRLCYFLKTVIGPDTTIGRASDSGAVDPGSIIGHVTP